MQLLFSCFLEIYFSTYDFLLLERRLRGLRGCGREWKIFVWRDRTEVMRKRHFMVTGKWGYLWERGGYGKNSNGLGQCNFSVSQLQRRVAIIVDVRLTYLTNITYLLTYLLTYCMESSGHSDNQIHRWTQSSSTTNISSAGVEGWNESHVKMIPQSSPPSRKWIPIHMSLGNNKSPFIWA